MLSDKVPKDTKLYTNRKQTNRKIKKRRSGSFFCRKKENIFIKKK